MLLAMPRRGARRIGNSLNAVNHRHYPHAAGIAATASPGMMRHKLRFTIAVIAILFCRCAIAQVSEQEAAQLTGRLTPVGAERAGNADGTIPAWTGGLVDPAPAPVQGHRPDPFAGEKPLFAITAQNWRDHADRLPEGARHLFQTQPDYRMDIYPPHRTAAAPGWVYDNIFRNATLARPAAEGIRYGVEGAVGGIPFPIPKDGYQAVWNHLLAFWGAAREVTVGTYVVPADGAPELTGSYREIADFPYYYRSMTPEQLGDYYFKTVRIATAPANRLGEAYLYWQSLNIKRHDLAAWRLLPGEQRVRKAPPISYDVPDPVAAGYMNQNEYYMFFGGMDHYSFRLVGKKEMYVPYNNNRLYQMPLSQVLGKTHPTPDALRYELHRVWVVEGTVAPDAHDVVSRRLLYLDEDTWMAVYADSWDENGKLWKFAHATMYVMPDVPAVVIGSQIVHDFELGGYAFTFAFNDEPVHYKLTTPHPAALFSPSALPAQAGR